MALTESNMIPLGTKAPGFTLPDTVSGNNMALADLVSEKATVIMFLCNHCPYVIYVNNLLIELANEYSAKGVNWVAISSNDAEAYPQDGPALMTKHAKETGYPFPYLYDESQEVAKAYDAACTPDIYLFDGEQKLAYRGQLDSARPGNQNPQTGNDLRAALDAVLSGEACAEKQIPSAGCNIKWKK